MNSFRRTSFSGEVRESYRIKEISDQQENFSIPAIFRGFSYSDEVRNSKPEREVARKAALSERSAILAAIRSDIKSAMIVTAINPKRGKILWHDERMAAIEAKRDERMAAIEAKYAASRAAIAATLLERKAAIEAELAAIHEERLASLASANLKVLDSQISVTKGTFPSI